MNVYKDLPDAVGHTHPSSNPVDDVANDGGDFVERTSSPSECLLGADRSSSAADFHAARIAVMAERMQLVPHRQAHDADHHIWRQRRNVVHRMYAARRQLRCGDTTDTPELLHREGVQELDLTLRLHHEEAIWLTDAAGNLGAELRASDADSDRQANGLPDVGAQDLGDFCGRTPEPP